MRGKSTVATSLLIAGGLMALAPSLAIGAEQSGAKIADGDSVYIDGKSFQVIPGTAKGDSTTQIKKLGARDLGPAAIIIRFRNKLYIADAEGAASARGTAPGPSNASAPVAHDPRFLFDGSAGYNYNAAHDYVNDPRACHPVLIPGGSSGYGTDYNPTLLGGGSPGYNHQVGTDYAYNPKNYYRPNSNGSGSPGSNYNIGHNYAYDARACNPVLMPGTDYAYDPRGYNPALLGGGRPAYNHHAATDYPYNPQGYPIRDPNPWANDYAYDPRLRAQAIIIEDPDYLEYRLKQAFAENWTPSVAASGNSR